MVLLISAVLMLGMGLVATQQKKLILDINVTPSEFTSFQIRIDYKVGIEEEYKILFSNVDGNINLGGGFERSGGLLRLTQTGVVNPGIVVSLRIYNYTPTPNTENNYIKFSGGGESTGLNSFEVYLNQYTENTLVLSQQVDVVATGTSFILDLSTLTWTELPEDIASETYTIKAYNSYADYLTNGEIYGYVEYQYTPTNGLAEYDAINQAVHNENTSESEVWDFEGWVEVGNSSLVQNIFNIGHGNFGDKVIYAIWTIETVTITLGSNMSGLWFGVPPPSGTSSYSIQIPKDADNTTITCWSSSIEQKWIQGIPQGILMHGLYVDNDIGETLNVTSEDGTVITYYVFSISIIDWRCVYSSQISVAIYAGDTNQAIPQEPGDADKGGAELTRCITPDTLITLSDNSQVRVDELQGDEELLVWNLETGSFDSAPIMFIDSDAEAMYNVIKLRFEDNTEVKVIYEHGFWDYDLNKYVYILEHNAYDFIGHTFAKQNGNLLEKVKLIDVEIVPTLTTAWSPITAVHLGYFVNGMMSMPGGTNSFINMFDFDEETITYDTEAMERDIETYGLYTYEELNAICALPEELFYGANAQYLKVSIAKGLMTLDELIYKINMFRDYV